jgi:hypothetical protein
MLDHHILAGHTKIGGAILDIGRHIGGAHDNNAHFRPIRLDDQFAGGFRVFTGNDTGGSQQRQGFVKNTTLGESNGDAVHGGILVGKKSILPQSSKARKTGLFFKQATLGLFNRADVGSLLALRAGNDVKSYLLVLGQGLETVALNCGEVSEQVLATFRRGDETETFGIVEPLNCTVCHFDASLEKINGLSPKTKYENQDRGAY